jgi:hypothetical protein
MWLVYLNHGSAAGLIDSLIDAPLRTSIHCFSVTMQKMTTRSCFLVGVLLPAASSCKRSGESGGRKRGRPGAERPAFSTQKIIRLS